MEIGPFLKELDFDWWKTAARACHQANRAICLHFGENEIAPDWAEAPESIKHSARAGVVYRIENPNSTPEDLHNAWMEQKINDGWVYGPIKSFEDKTHPCLVPYDTLPESQKLKNKIFQAIVDAIV